MSKADRDQTERFEKAARELGADQESDADALMRRMAKMKPEPRKPPPAERNHDENDKPGQ